MTGVWKIYANRTKNPKVISFAQNMVNKTDWIFMLLSILLLIALFIPEVGTSVNGSIRWIRIGPINIQPSEICKFSLSLIHI